MKALVRTYKRLLSPLLPPACRFVPSCSDYSHDAYDSRGFCIGTVLTARRVLRCHPWCEGGHDPVPQGGPRS